MAMIFIGGSRDIFELPEPVIARIGAMIAAEHGLLAGSGYDYGRRQRRRSWRPTVERDRVRRGNTSPIPSIRPILADTIQAAIAPYATMRPDAPALVRPGMAVRTSYGTGGIVIAVKGPAIHIAQDGNEYPHFTIVYVPADLCGRHSKLDHNWINECVVVDGRILKLREANSDEVFVEAMAPGPS